MWPRDRGGWDIEARRPRVAHRGGTGPGPPSQAGQRLTGHSTKARTEKGRLTSPSPSSPPSSSQVKAESLGIPQKLQLKVDVESGKLIIKKSKDGSEDKFYSHKKSKVPLTPVTLSLC